MRPIPTARTRLLALLLLLAGALALAGCLGGEDIGGSDEGSGGDPGPAAAGASGPEAAVLAAAATRTTQTGTAKLEMTMAVSLPGAPDRVDVRLTGAFDLDAQRGRLAFDYGSLLAALPAGPQQDQVSALLPDRMVFDVDAVYLRMPNLPRIVPDARKWIKFDANEIAAQQGLNVTGVDQLGQADPTQLLALLESIDGSIEDLGREDVRGVAATHYRATIDMGQLAATAPPEQEALLQGQLDQLGQIGLDALPVEVWVDDEGRVVRLYSTIVVPDTGTGGGTIELDMELYDFGAPVEVKTPAPRNVAGVEALLGAVSPSIQG